jgi:hypothetical protein
VSFTFTQPIPGLFHLDFDSMEQMSKTLIRPQEYAESPKFQGRVFTTSRLKNYFKSFKESPYTCYVGFNIPGSCIVEFFNKFSNFNSAELRLKEVVAQAPERFYLIGSADRDAKKPSWKAGDHELAHACWYLREDYKLGCQAVIAEVPEQLITSMRNRLLSWGCYAPIVIEDEIHAYLGTDALGRLSQRFHWHVLPPEIEVAHDKLNTLLQKTLGRTNG